MTDFLLRIPLQFFAESPDDDTTPPTDPETPPADPDTPPATPPEDDPGKKQVTMTQAELDELLKKQFGKGARKAKAQTPTAPTGGDDGNNAAAETLKLANERLLAGTVRGLCADLGINAKGAKAAIKLADFSGCLNASGVDEDAAKDALEEFLEDYPEFKAKAEENPDTGTGGKPNPGRQKPKSEGGLGARLAKQQTSAPIKSSFFKN